MVAEGGAIAVLHKGMMPFGHRKAGNGLGGDLNRKVIVTTVEEALIFCADAVSIYINLGVESRGEMLKNAGEISRSCEQWGISLVVMVYPRGPAVTNPFDVDTLKRCARCVAELGADMVKTSYTCDINTFREVVRGA